MNSNRDKTKELLLLIVAYCRDIIDYLHPEDYRLMMDYFDDYNLNLDNKDLLRIESLLRLIWVDVLYGSLNN